MVTVAEQIANAEYARQQREEAVEAVAMSIFEKLDGAVEITRQDVLKAITEFEGEIKPTLDQVEKYLLEIDIKVVEQAAEVVEAVETTVSENPLAVAAGKIVGILGDNINSGESVAEVLKRCSPAVIQAMTEGRRGKTALNAENTWKAMVTLLPKLGNNGAAHKFFIEAFSNLRTTSPR